MVNTSFYDSVKLSLINENDSTFVSNLLLYSDDEIISLIKGLQIDLYRDYHYFSSFKKKIVTSVEKDNERLFSVFNILYCLEKSLLKESLKYLLVSFKPFYKLLAALLPGAIRNYPEFIEFLVSHPNFDPTAENKKLLKKFFLARGYPFGRIDEILGIDSHLVETYKNNSKMRVALLVSGQVRGIEAALKSWQKVFNFSDVELDVFVSTWKLSHQPKEIIWSRVGTRNLTKRIKDLSIQMTNEETLSLLSNYLPPKILDESYLTNLFEKYLVTNNISVELEWEERYFNFTNPMKLYYKIHRAFEMSKKHGVYDLYIRIRPDLHLSNKNAINIRNIEEELAKQRCILTHYPYVLEYYGFGVDDKIAIGKFDCMQIYANTWVFDGNNPNALGHVNLANNLAYHQVNCRKIEGLEVSFSNYNILDISQVENEFNKID